MISGNRWATMAPTDARVRGETVQPGDHDGQWARRVGLKQRRSMTRSRTGRPLWLLPANSSIGSSDETRSLSGTAGLQPPTLGSGGAPNGDPSKIGRYRIIHRLGQGGFGRVYLAHDDDLDRPVAIKVPNPERITHPEDVEAFLIEARILARLDHPHIVPVFDVGRTEDGLCFVVSKLVEGSDLAVRMGQARPSFRDSAELVATDRRRLALRPHPRAGPPGHQARQHPDRRLGQTVRGRLRARPQGRGLRQGWRAGRHTGLHESRASQGRRSPG